MSVSGDAYRRNITEDSLVAGHFGHCSDKAFFICEREFLVGSPLVLARASEHLKVAEEGLEGGLLEREDLGVERVPVGGFSVGGVMSGGEEDNDLKDGGVLHHHG